MRSYEMMVVISPQVGDDGFSGVLGQVDQLVTNRGGVIETTLTNPPWGHRKLAYPIRDFRDAYFAVVHLQLDPTQVAPLERDLGLFEPVIRSLVIRRDDLIRAEAKAAVRRASAPQIEPEPEIDMEPEIENDEAEEDDDGGEGTE